MSQDDSMKLMASMMAEQFRTAMLSVLEENRHMQADLRKEIHEEREAMRAEFRLQTASSGAGSMEPRGPSIDALESRITDFIYDPDDEVIFDSWYARYREVFEEEASSLPYKAKVRMLLRHVSLPVAERYRDFIAPDEATSISFENTVKTMSTLFGKTVSVFERRLQIIHLKMSELCTGDVRVLACEVNKLFTRAALKDIDPEELRTTLFLAAMDDPRLTDVRIQLLKMVSENPKTTLNELVEECGKLAALKRDSKVVVEPLTKTVNVVSKPKTWKPQGRNGDNTGKSSRRGHHYKSSKKEARNRDMSTVTCYFCQRTGHIARDCRKRQKTDGVRQHHVQCNVVTQRVYATVELNGREVDLQVDSGSDWTMISQKEWEHLGRPPLQPVLEKPKCANDQELTVKGKFQCTMKYLDKKGHGVVYVSMNRCLLGLDWFPVLEAHRAFLPASEIIDVCQVVDPENEYRSLIGKDFPELSIPGLGLCTRMKASLLLKEGSKPVFRSARSIPLSKREAIDAELDRLESLGVISKRSYSQWAAPIHAVQKANGSVRVCADYKTGLNQSLHLHTHPLPLPEDIFACLNGATVFSQLDFAEAYLQVEVDEEAKELLTVNTHRGLYQYNRLPFGVKSAPEFFKRSWTRC